MSCRAESNLLVHYCISYTMKFNVTWKSFWRLSPSWLWPWTIGGWKRLRRSIWNHCFARAIFLVTCDMETRWKSQEDVLSSIALATNMLTIMVDRSHLSLLRLFGQILNFCFLPGVLKVLFFYQECFKVRQGLDVGCSFPKFRANSYL